MSSISIDVARSTYGGRNQAETLKRMASKLECNRIYSYRNNFQPWWRWSHTDYFRIEKPGDEDRISQVPGAVLVYDLGEVRLWRQHFGIMARLLIILALLAPLVWFLLR
ncbi:MAG: hypothetical protein ACT4OZ_02225 [Gemmatimonadota bacterium]